MTKQEKGDYKFNTDYQLAVNEEGLPTGHYRQNVDHYVFMQERMRQKMALNLWIQEKRLLQCCVYCSQIAGWHDKYTVSGRD